MGNKTPLYAAHVEFDGKMVDFGGWDMPLHYGSQVDEHHVVRQDAGMFDVSHMTVVDLRGAGAKAFLSNLLANDIARLKDAGKAMYSCMLQDDGGVIDDLIVYYMTDDWYRMVVNAATRVKDMAWINKQSAAFDVEVTERPELAMIAVQGPSARERAVPLLPEDLREPSSALKPFFAAENGEWFVGRTGYTGEDGFEVVMPEASAASFWKALFDAGVKPCGLGARDTLRLEAGMNLYGSDMDETISPLEAGLNWTVAWEPAERDFIGRKAIEAQKAEGKARKFVGLILQGRGVIRNHQAVNVGDETGEVTSGGVSPTLQASIAFARVPATIGDECTVDIRGKGVPAKVVRPPFVRNGKSCID